MTTYTVTASQPGNNLFIGLGDEEDVESGGIATSTTVDQGSAFILSGGVSNGATLTNYANQTVYAGATVSNETITAGAGEVLNGGTSNGATVSNGGYQDASQGGTANNTHVTAGGSLTVFGGVSHNAVIDASGSETINQGVADNTTVNAGGVEIIQSGGSATGTTLALSGSIDVPFLAFAAGGTASVDTMDVLTVTEGGVSYTTTLSGSYAGQFFTLSPDTDGPPFTPGTMITLASAPCFCSGTRILTDRGEVAVEELAPGDRVVSLIHLGVAAIKWIGHRRIICSSHPRPEDVMPVRVRAGAFGPGLPHRDLMLSPDHAVYTDGVLIPIRHLVNGDSVTPETRQDVTYWHVELDQHDVILGEGLPCESYLDTGNRASFANGGALVQLHPAFAAQVWAKSACAPLVLDGPALDAVRARLADLAPMRAARVRAA